MFQDSKYELKIFDSKCKIANNFFNQIDEIWLEKGETQPVSNQMKYKLFKENKYQNFPFIAYFNNEPIGILWVELTTQYYGSVSLFVPNEIHCNNVLKKIYDHDFFNNKMIEIIGIDSLDKYKHSCFNLGLTSNIRKRMYLWLTNIDYFDLGQHPFEFKMYTENYYDWSSELSVRAHAISKDYEYYIEMLYPENRKLLEEKVLKGLYGNIIQPASLVLYYNKKPVGFCSVVEVKCWGYERVPWVFDICIDPAFHGQGMGNILTKKMLNKLIELGYEVMGLAVTLTNKYAMKMYQKYGFLDLDVFYEFVNHDLSKEN